VKKDFRGRQMGIFLKRELATLIDRAAREYPGVFFTVTEVKPSKDVAYADVWVSFFGKDEKKASAFEWLKRNAGRFRYELARILTIRKVPEIRFKMDETLVYAAKIDSLLKEVNFSDESSQSEGEIEE